MSDENSRPAAEGLAAGHYPASPVAAGHVAPCPRRIRVRDDSGWLLDTVEALYCWEHPYYPQYAVPRAGLAVTLVEASRPVPDEVDTAAAGHVLLPFTEGLRFFEEDEEVHGHPRSPYVRVDALRSHRAVTVVAPAGDPDEKEQVLASTTDCVVVLETGLPPRYYLDPTCVDWSLLTPTDTETRCPYKGLTSGWWNLGEHDDVAWSYAAPTLALSPIAGLVSFDDTQVDVRVDGATTTP